MHLITSRLFGLSHLAFLPLTGLSWTDLRPMRQYTYVRELKLNVSDQ